MPVQRFTLPVGTYIIYFCWTCSNFCISSSISFNLRTDNLWKIPDVRSWGWKGQRSSRGQSSTIIRPWAYFVYNSVNVFVEITLITVFLNQFCSNLGQIILGQYQMRCYRDDKVKGHVGVIGQICKACANFCIKLLLFLLNLHSFLYYFINFDQT